MGLPHVQFTLRRLMGWIAVAALASLTVAMVMRKWQAFGVWVLIICAVGSAFGVAAVRFPLESLAALCVIWLITPSVDHPGPLEIATYACYLGWFLGAPAGLIARQLRGEPPPYPFRRRSGRDRS